jgi:hypothetical protein
MSATDWNGETGHKVAGRRPYDALHILIAAELQLESTWADLDGFGDYMI